MNIMDKASVVAEFYLKAFEEYWTEGVKKTLPEEAYTYCLYEANLQCTIAYSVAFGYLPEEHIPVKTADAIADAYSDIVEWSKWV